MAIQLKKRRFQGARMPPVVAYSLIIALLLVIVAGGLGVLYVWYIGQDDSDVAVKAPVAASTPDLFAEPSAPAPDARVGVSIQTITSPISPGSNASVTIHTLPTADCSITVNYNSVASKDSGLVPRQADKYGAASWAWTVGADVPPGKWPVTVTCSYNKKSAVVVGDLVVVKDTGH